jgi:hypothetical protein
MYKTKLYLTIIIFFLKINLIYPQSAMAKYWISTNSSLPVLENDLVRYPNSPNGYYETFKLDYRNLINPPLSNVYGKDGIFNEGEIGDKENNLFNKFARIEGYIIPPSSGNYIFYVAGTPSVSFFLSTSESPLQSNNIANTTSATGYQQWNLSPSQTSAPILLQEGQRYYFEFKYDCPQGGYNSNQSFSAAWSGPGFGLKVIEGNDMQPYLPFDDVSAPTRNLDSFSGNIATWLNIWTSRLEPWWNPDFQGNNTNFSKIFIDGTYKQIDWCNLKHINDALNQMKQAGVTTVIFDQTNNVSRTEICRSVQLLAALKGMKVAHARDCADPSPSGVYSGEWADSYIYERSVLYQPFGISNYLNVDGKPLMVLYCVNSKFNQEMTRTDAMFLNFTYVAADAYAPGRELWGWQLRTSGAVPSSRGMFVSGASCPVASILSQNSPSPDGMWMSSINFLDYNFLKAKQQNPSFLIVGSWDDYGERNNWAKIDHTNAEIKYKNFNQAGAADNLVFNNRVKEWLLTSPTSIPGGLILDGAYRMKNTFSNKTLRSKGNLTTIGSANNYHFSTDYSYKTGNSLEQNDFVDDIHNFTWFYHLGNNEYKIIPAYTGLPLEANNINDAISTELPNLNNNQIWIATLNPNGSFKFRNKQTNKYISIAGNALTNNALVKQKSQVITNLSLNWELLPIINIPTSQYEQCIQTNVLNAMYTSNGWTYYGNTTTQIPLFAIEHNPTNGNQANFNATVIITKFCDLQDNIYAVTNSTSKTGVFIAGHYWNIQVNNETINGFVNLRFFTEDDYINSLIAKSNTFYVNENINHKSNPIYFKTNNPLNLPNDIRSDALGLNYDFSALTSTISGIYAGKNYVQFNNVTSIVNSGGGSMVNVTNLTQNNFQTPVSVGSLRFNSTTNKFEGWDGTNWVILNM